MHFLSPAEHLGIPAVLISMYLVVLIGLSRGCTLQDPVNLDANAVCIVVLDGYSHLSLLISRV